MPDCSVVIPTYNRAASLARVLAPLAEVAASGGVEVIVVDDGSTDRTPDVLRDLPWVEVIRQANAGPAAARNAGWRTARADVVVFTDDDCRPSAGWPLTLVGDLDATGSERVGGVGGEIRGIGRSTLDRFVEVERLVDHGRDLSDGGVDYLVTANVAFRRVALEAVDGFDESFPAPAAEDVDLSWRLRAAGWTLERSPAAVGHEHRTSVGDVLRTYRKHGAGRAVLDARHPDRTAARAAGSAVGLGAWRERYGSHRRSGTSRGAAVGLLVLRAAGLAAFGWGLVRGRRVARRDSTLAGGVERREHGVEVRSSDP